MSTVNVDFCMKSNLKGMQNYDRKVVIYEGAMKEAFSETSDILRRLRKTTLRAEFVLATYNEGQKC